jgi:hypothetical protein
LARNQVHLWKDCCSDRKIELQLILQRRSLIVARQGVPSFLTANWRYLAMLNYVVDPRLITPLVPAETEMVRLSSVSLGFCFSIHASWVFQFRCTAISKK